MTAQLSQTLQARGPTTLLVAAGAGILWNAYGVWQFALSFFQTRDSLVATGMTPSQAELYLSLPGWISVAFAIGVFGGLVGSVALLMKRVVALPVFGVSLAGYAVLFAGDAYYGVFANIPSQLVILAIVVAIAAALLAVTFHARNRGRLA
jgi:hypothetical protein